MIAQLEKLLDGPRDGALLRFSLGNEYLKAGQPDRAVAFYRDAIARDASYSAAWKGLGKALGEAGQLVEALQAYREGIEVATSRGDKQAAKEMTVFARRIERQLNQSDTQK
ncbi:tetratricopeptide repeat protein [Chitinimonas sp. PSY-7]|uniref:tetratricopeptide repeat protein n=1 Tax=Chitinimonas sp. PSY-7 TaxID=3459088 RepID=UPI00403FDAC6